MRAGETVLVTGSGNDAWAKGMRPPACIEGVIFVGAVYHTNLASASFLELCTDKPAEIDRVTCFSNSSYLLDLLARGYHVRTTYKNGVANVDGTSFQRRMWPCCGRSIRI
ncbi:MAG TPA: S8/S53 family peptidase [Thermoanaerobaculia bacterium]|nr:S8/S53 family peptidase [Thermoanaerobaculia bacterium]